MNFSGDGTVSFEEFVEIVSNIGDENSGTLADQDQEEQELRDAFRVSPLSFLFYVIPISPRSFEFSRNFHIHGARRPPMRL